MTDIILHPNQVEHYNNISNWLKTKPLYFELSPTGTGKTYVTSNYALKHNLNLYIICPVAAKPIWNIVANKHYINISSTMTYQMLRTLYIDITYIENLCEEGTLFIFDEGHSIKNKSKQSEAVIKLSSFIISYIELNKCKSRVVFISATPYDKPAHSEQLIRFMGIDIKNIYDFCYKLDPDETSKRSKISYTTHNLFVNVICKHYGFIMPKVKGEFNVTIHNICFKPKNEDLKVTITESLNTIKSYIDDKMSWGIIIETLGKLESIKVRFIIDYIKANMKPNHKYIICCDRLASLDILMAEFEDDGILCVKGSLKPNERTKMIHKFNNDDDYKLLCMTSASGGQSISLHDISGNFNREMYIIPSYNMLNIIQSIGRIDRIGLQSNGNVYITYLMIDDKLEEISLLRSLSNKKKVIENITCDTCIPDTYNVIEL